MYKKFKDCLLHPARIAIYINERFFKFFLYTAFLVLLFILPNIVQLTSFKGLKLEQLNKITESFIQEDPIDYQLISKDGKTVLSSVSDIPRVVPLESMFMIDVVLLFSIDELYLGDYGIPSKYVNKNTLYIQFTKDKVSAFVANYIPKQIKVDVPVFEVSNVRINTIKFSKTYDQIGFKEFDFSKASDNSTMFSLNLNKLFVSIYKKNIVLAFAILIPLLFIIGLGSIIIEALIFSLFVKIISRVRNLPFRSLFKIVVFTYTPRVIFGILSIIFSSFIISLIGEFISIVYIFIAIRAYSQINHQQEN